MDGKFQRKTPANSKEILIYFIFIPLFAGSYNPVPKSTWMVVDFPRLSVAFRSNLHQHQSTRKGIFAHRVGLPAKTLEFMGGLPAVMDPPGGRPVVVVYVHV